MFVPGMERRRGQGAPGGVAPPSGAGAAENVPARSRGATDQMSPISAADQMSSIRAGNPGVRTAVLGWEDAQRRRRGGRTGGGRPLPGEHAFLNAVDANDLVNLCRCVDVSFYEARVSAVSSPEVRFQMSTTFVQKMVLGAAAAAAVMTLASGCGSTGKGPGGGSAPTPTSGTSPTSSAPGGGGAAF